MRVDRFAGLRRDFIARFARDHIARLRRDGLDPKFRERVTVDTEIGDHHCRSFGVTTLRAFGATASRAMADHRG